MYSNFFRMIKPLYSFFSLPFLFASVLLSISKEIKISCVQVVCSFVAFFCARSAGMVMNNVWDVEIDAYNSRTAMRSLPQGIISIKEALLGGALLWGVFFSLLIVLDRKFAPLFILSAVWINLYPLTKRFSSLCHLFLGGVFFLAVWTASLFFQNSLTLPTCFLALCAGLTVAANDIIYAIQDIKVDQELNLFSIPSRVPLMQAVGIAILLLFIGWGSFFFISWHITKGTSFRLASVLPLGAIAYIASLYLSILKASEKEFCNILAFKSFQRGNFILPHSYLLSIILWRFL